MVREYGPFRERFEEYILERTANYLSFEIWCDSWHPILQKASDLIEIERPLPPQSRGGFSDRFRQDGVKPAPRWKERMVCPDVISEAQSDPDTHRAGKRGYFRSRDLE